jgi:hypothetical protein
MELQPMLKIVLAGPAPATVTTVVIVTNQTKPVVPLLMQAGYLHVKTTTVVLKILLHAFATALVSATNRTPPVSTVLLRLPPVVVNQANTHFSMHFKILLSARNVMSATIPIKHHKLFANRVLLVCFRMNTVFI